MKKKIVSTFLVFSILMTSASSVFAFDTIPLSKAKEIPLTINGIPYNSEFPVLFSNGKTYISSPDLADITGMQINAPSSVTYFDVDGSPLAYFPIRDRFEALDGYVKWENFSIDAFLPLPTETNTENVFIGSDVLYSPEELPANVDGVNTNLKITSLTPHISNKSSDATFYNEVESALTADQKELEDILTKVSFDVKEENVDTTAPNYVSHYEYYDIYDVLVNQDGFLSVLLDSYDYEGGAHGIRSKKVVNIDLKNEELLSLPNLFLDDADYKTLLLSEIEKSMQYPSYDGEYEFVNVPTELPKDDAFYFDFDNQTLTVFYEPYELSAGARSFVYFYIPLANIQDSLKNTYKYEYTSNLY